MERRFCGNCGMPVGSCTCGVSNGPTTGFGGHKADEEIPGRSGSYYIRRFDKIALIQDEVVVKQYHIGEFAKGLGIAGKGSASIIITNKRVISKQDSDYFGSSNTSVEEIMLDTVMGVKNYYSQGYTIWRLVVAAISALFGIISLITTFASSRYGIDALSLLISLGLCGLAVYMAFTSRKPSYLFSIYSSASNRAMEMGANLRGKIFNSNGNGILFQYKPTKEAVKMMCEIGACIVDLKTKGDYAIEAWKNA